MIKCDSITVNNLTPSSFYQSVNILVTKPHVVNKRLWGQKIWFRYFCRSSVCEWSLPKNCNKLEKNVLAENVEQITMSLLRELKIEKCDATNIDAGHNNFIEVIFTELLPKSYTDSKAFQLICINKEQQAATFYNVTPEKYSQNLCPDFPFTLKLKNNEIVLIANNDGNSKAYLWLVTTILPQVIKWGNETKCNPVMQSICTESLALVSKEKYYNKYNELKLKYGKEMVQIWPECTDPSKFVYEDVAIATYLILLWEDEGRNTSAKKTFVDFGCGNGLLVYILTKEGHNGVGIDVRKRQIWDLYTTDVKLEEKTITPSDFSLFPETDWIIGNHSDELTPWIPVMAAKSSFKCNFFLLPCCAYNFDGTKYQRKNAFKSLYTDYLEHIQNLCIECGFNTNVDRLKIPSTKRICFVSNGRSYNIDKHQDNCKKLKDIIERDSTLVEDENQGTWIKDFKPRDTVERVRNCTQIDKNLIESIVVRITNYLLEECGSAYNTQWFAGKTVEINQLVQLIPQNELKQLKSECGGLQTLLKNNHHIFKVQSGKLQLRYPKTVEEAKTISKKHKNKLSKTIVQHRPCWFYNNHPQGCPLTETNCSFLHITKS